MFFFFFSVCTELQNVLLRKKCLTYLYHILICVCMKCCLYFIHSVVRNSYCSKLCECVCVCGGFFLSCSFLRLTLMFNCEQTGFLINSWLGAWFNIKMLKTEKKCWKLERLTKKSIFSCLLGLSFCNAVKKCFENKIIYKKEKRCQIEFEQESNFWHEVTILKMLTFSVITNIETQQWRLNVGQLLL